MRSWIIVASLFAAHTAFAQAPGEQPANFAPVQPVLVAPPPPPPMRWSVGLSIGGLGLAPESMPDNKTNFSIGELSLQYRPTYHLELQLQLGGGREQLPDNKGQGDLEASTVALSLRYRFRPAQAWNWWLSAGVGAITVASHEATDQEKKDASRGMFQLGIGLERRWTHFALNAELRAVGVGQKDPSQDMATPVANTTNTPPPATMPDDKVSGGQFTIGANYYF
jgi:opacity protein-like surface antigen